MDRKSALEFKTQKTIEQHQIQLLREQISYLSRHSAFYRRILHKKGLHSSSIKTLKDLSDFPLTTKEQIQEHNRSFYCVNKNEIADIVSTTGTTGDPVFIVLTKHDLQRLARNEVYSFSCAGATSQDIFHLSVTLDNLFMAGIAYYSGIIELGASVYRAGMYNIERQIILLQKLKPTGIMTVPSFLLQLGKEICERGINLSCLSVKKALLVGESIRDKDFNLSGIGALLNKMWPLDLYSTFGNSEAAISFCECPCKLGAHEHPEFIITEIVDERGKVVPDGESGELVLTTLQVEGMPLLRYCTGDITFKLTEPCSCGRSSCRIGPILGRKAHMLKYKGTKVYPRAIENAIGQVAGVRNYVIEAFTGDNFSDKIVVKVGCTGKTKAFKHLLASRIEAYARVTPLVQLVSPREIDELQSEHGRSRKIKTFLDHRKSIKH